MIFVGVPVVHHVYHVGGRLEDDGTVHLFHAHVQWTPVSIVRAFLRQCSTTPANEQVANSLIMF